MYAAGGTRDGLILYITVGLFGVDITGLATNVETFHLSELSSLPSAFILPGKLPPKGHVHTRLKFLTRSTSAATYTTFSQNERSNSAHHGAVSRAVLKQDGPRRG